MFATEGSHSDGPRGAKNFKNRLAVAARRFAACHRGSRKIARKPLGNWRESCRENSIESVVAHLADRVAGAAVQKTSKIKSVAVLRVHRGEGVPAPRLSRCHFTEATARPFDPILGAGRASRCGAPWPRGFSTSFSKAASASNATCDRGPEYCGCKPFWVTRFQKPGKISRESVMDCLPRGRIAISLLLKINFVYLFFV